MIFYGGAIKEERFVVYYLFKIIIKIDLNVSKNIGIKKKSILSLLSERQSAQVIIIEGERSFLTDRLLGLPYTPTWLLPIIFSSLQLFGC